MRDLQKSRLAIEIFDEKLLELIALRMDEVEVIGQYKHENRLPIKDAVREGQLLTSLMAKGSALGLDQQFINALYGLIIEYSCKQQHKLINNRQI
jgi:chorismate mutase